MKIQARKVVYYFLLGLVLAVGALGAFTLLSGDYLLGGILVAVANILIALILIMFNDAD